MGPQRLQRSRRRGYQMPAGAVYVGRPTRWGNPYPLGPGRTALQAVAEYRGWLDLNPRLEAEATSVLAGHDLVCWCPPGAP